MRAHAIPPEDWTEHREDVRRATLEKALSTYGSPETLASALVGFLMATDQLDDFYRWASDQRSPSRLVDINDGWRFVPYLVVSAHEVEEILFDGSEWTVRLQARW